MSSSTNHYWAVVPAAGGGSRMGAALPKQYLKIAGRSLIEWSLQPLLDARWIEGVVVVLPAKDSLFRKLQVSSHAKIHYAAGAPTRAGSVLAGLNAIHARNLRSTYALVHDAARPCVQAADLVRLRDEASDRQGGLLATPAVDTLKQSKKDRVQSTLDRSTVWQAQTPQMFRVDLLRKALEDCAARDIAVTDEASAMETAGYRPRLVESSAGNLKVTYPVDLKLAEFWLTQNTKAHK